MVAHKTTENPDQFFPHCQACRSIFIEASLCETIVTSTSIPRVPKMNQKSKSSFSTSNIREGVILVQYRSSPYANTKHVDSRPDQAVYTPWRLATSGKET